MLIKVPRPNVMQAKKVSDGTTIAGCYFTYKNTILHVDVLGRDIPCIDSGVECAEIDPKTLDYVYEFKEAQTA